MYDRLSYMMISVSAQKVSADCRTFGIQLGHYGMRNFLDESVDQSDSLRKVDAFLIKYMIINDV